MNDQSTIEPPLNSFQQWAITYFAEHGLTATRCANWVEMEKRGLPLKCFTVEGVKDAVRCYA